MIALLSADFLVGRVVHDQHQRHLAAAIQVHTPTVSRGDPVMILQIPSIGLNQVVADGTDSSELRGGPGLVTESAFPTHRGTSVILGHRYRYGGPFHDLGNVTKGDPAAIKLRDGTVHTYKVDRVATATRSNRAAFAPVKAGRIVLVTNAAGLWPDRLLEVTLAPDAAATAGHLTRTPITLADPSAIGFLLVALLVAASTLGLALASRRLRAHYRLGTVLVVLLPILGMLLVVGVFALDLVVAATY